MDIYYIDRIEGNIVICQGENGEMTELSKDILPQGREGDCVVYDGNTYTIDYERTQKRKEDMDSLLDSLFS